MSNEWFYPRGRLARDGWESVVGDELSGWQHTGLRIGVLADKPLKIPAASVERILVPLCGSFEIEHDGTTTTLAGRDSVFDGPTDVLYVGSQEAIAIHGRGRVAVAEAASTHPLGSRYIAREHVPIEIRGAGRDTRQVQNFGTPDVLDAASIIACEVITPAGNWSSYPPHKHDETVPGHESELEEIYYFEVAPADSSAPADADAFATFSTFSSPRGAIDTNALVRTGDIALVPYGYHGPAAAPPEYDLYYLNVMAGPGRERVWLVTDDPRQSWIRSTWEDKPSDPRLPLGATTGGAE